MRRLKPREQKWLVILGCRARVSTGSPPWGLETMHRKQEKKLELGKAAERRELRPDKCGEEARGM